MVAALSLSLIQGAAIVSALESQQVQPREPRASGYDDGLAAGRRILAKKRLSPLHDTPRQLLRAAIKDADTEYKRLGDQEDFDERAWEYVGDYVDGLRAAEAEARES